MRVLLVTTWDTACGIAEHAAYLRDAVQAADPTIEVVPSVTALDPDRLVDRLGWVGPPDIDVVHLNYHRALHSRWTVEQIQRVQARGVRVVVTFHDTGTPNDDLCRAICGAADAAVVHEPCDDLPGAVYLRQGIPAGMTGLRSWFVDSFRKAYPAQPLVGSVGFPFPWKNYDLLAEASAQAGWALLLLAPNATAEQIVRWHALNPHTKVVREFTPREELLIALSACDATTFLYCCANTGTSAAIRQGIAARKPVLASSVDACRQFRDLWADPVGRAAITWLGDLSVGGVARALAATPVGGVATPVVALAAQDSWAAAGAAYARILRGAR